MTLDELEKLCDSCTNPLGVTMKVPGRIARADHKRQMVLAGVWGLILKECPDEKSLIVGVKVADLRRFIARMRKRLVPIGVPSQPQESEA